MHKGSWISDLLRVPSFLRVEDKAKTELKELDNGVSGKKSFKSI